MQLLNDTSRAFLYVRIMMLFTLLTGVNTTSAHAVAAKLKIDSVEADFLPEQNAIIAKELQAAGKLVTEFKNDCNNKLHAQIHWISSHTKDTARHQITCLLEFSGSNSSFSFLKLPDSY
jgi:hypothetical protein